MSLAWRTGDRERPGFAVKTGREPEVKAVGSHTGRSSEEGLPVGPVPAVLWGPGMGGG